MLIRPTRRELIKYGIGAAAFAKMARAQVRVPGPGGAASGGGGGGWSLVAHTGKAGASGGADFTTSAINTSGANLIVVGIGSYSTSPSVSDSLGNTWTRLNVYTQSADPNIALFYCYNPTTGSSDTFTTSTGNAYPVMMGAAFSGSSASPFDQQNGAASTGLVTSQQPGSITPTANNELIVTLFGDSNCSSIPTIDSGFTITDAIAYNGSSNYGGAVAYLFQNTATAINPAWSITSSGNTVSSIASFK